MTVFGFDTEKTRHAFEVNVESRTIQGLAVPYDVPSQLKDGERFQFSQGSIRIPADVSRVKLLVSHDRAQAIGKATALEDTPEGLHAKFKVARGPEGDRALAMAEDGVLDGLSVGLRAGGKFTRKSDINHAVGHDLAEISLTPDPAFSDARVSAVAAEAESYEREADMADSQTQPSVEAASFDTTPIADAISRGFAQLVPQQRQVISAAGAPVFQVTEQPMYGFEGRRGRYDFSTDLIAGGKGDKEAENRVLQFMASTFDVDQADAATLNPVPTRADMYVDQREYLYPLWNAVNRGTLSDGTPFIVPKFNTATSLVAAHVEGVEPTAGTFTATSQTITPAAVSGRVEITRELWDQGGNPQVSTLIWRQMTRAWFEALEAFVVTTLDAASPTGITLTTAAADDDLSDDLSAAFAALQFVRGGFRFDQFAVQRDLYNRLATAVDSTGRPLFPMIAPQNANGTAAARYASMDIAGVRAYPSWALAASGAVAASSYLFDRDAVSAWASAPQRLEFQYRVAYVDLAIWGYKAAAITDLAGVREVIYDPTA